MSCKYCELKMRPTDGGLKVLKGETWEDDCDGRYIEQFHDDKFRMHISYDAGYAYTSVNNIKYCPFCGAELTMPKEPLIKDEKIRKAVRAWAEADEIDTVQYDEYWRSFRSDDCVIGFKTEDTILNLKDGEWYTITELCGEEEQCEN